MAAARAFRIASRRSAPGRARLALTLASLLVCILPAPVLAQSQSPDEALPVDPRATVGKLENGVTYYLQANHKPEKRAFLVLAVDAGSILEDDDQQGLAHFVEHMAFNGTRSFAKHQIIDYLESIGMSFGPEINGSTGFDETLYMLEVPTDSSGVVDKGIQILSEWAGGISFDDAEIDKERGVVIEEWRLGRGAWARMTDKELPIILKDSKYANRLAIGKLEVLENFDHEAPRRFYRDWYRPDLMAVIAVGDFDVGAIQASIKTHFSAIPMPAGPKPRPWFEVPAQDQTLVAIVTDKEATQTSLTVYHKMPVTAVKTVADYGTSLVEGLYNRMLNARLFELTQQPEPPFVSAYSGNARFIRAKEFYLLAADVKEDGIELGLETVVGESERVRRFGFTQSELDRQKDQMLRQLEVAYNERDKTESRNLAMKYMSHFLNEEPPVAGVEYEYNLAKRLVPGISLEEVNALASEWTSNRDNVIVLEAPEKEGLAIPTSEDLLAIVADARLEHLTPYDDRVSDKPLLAAAPEPSRVVIEDSLAAIGVAEWTLANGVKVILKPTDFKNDEIQFAGFSRGGTSLVEDDEFIPAWFASTLVGLSGVGDFDLVSLQKHLAGRVVSVQPYIDEMGEGLRGSASPADIQTMFELIYCYFTASRLDSVSYLSYKSRMETWLKNRDADPGNAFSDTIGVTLAQHHPRRPILTAETLGKMDLDESRKVYRERFADASDFTFAFVGAFDAAAIRPLVETYLGGLPSLSRAESWRDLGIHPPTGVIRKEIRKGIEPKSRVSLSFAGPFPWSFQEAYDLGSMADALRIKLREVVREDQSGTYDVSVGASSWMHPDQEYSVSITFGCDPKRVEELVAVVFAEIDSLRSVPLDETYVTKVREAQRRDWEVNLKQNGFWLGRLRYYYFNDLPRDQFVKYAERVEGLTAEAIRSSAERYLGREHYVEVILYPETVPE